jgi:indolepyruvate ferredoxin oxidoreductase alpha subunit
VIIIEEGQPFIEERLRGILPPDIGIAGRLNPGYGGGGALNLTGELDPDNVRRVLCLPPRPTVLNAGENGITIIGAPLNSPVEIPRLPERPPQLCAGCPHGDSYETIKKAVEELDGGAGHPSTVIAADIGCYALGAMPPYEVPDSIVCMGASIGMARGAAEAGIPYAIGVIGDSTFLHSGITGLIDAAAAAVPMTVVILDNATVAMTGCQETILPSSRLRELILGAGIGPEHLLELEAKKQLLEENAAALKREIEYRGPSVVIFRRECLEAFRKRRKREGGTL